MKIKKLFLTLFLSCFSAGAYAQQFNFGLFDQVYYDDNVYMTHDNEESSVVNSIAAFASYNMRIPDTKLKLLVDGYAGYQSFTRDQSKNDFPFASLNAEVNNDLFTFGNHFVYTSEQATLALDNRAERMQNIAFLSAKTSTNKLLGVGFFINDIYDNYFSSDYEYLSRNRIDAGARVYLNITSKTALYAEYKFSSIAYQENRDNDSLANTVSAGIKGLIAPKVTAAASVSYDMRNYDKDFPGMSKDKDLFEYSVRLEWEPTSQNIVRLTSARMLDEIAYGNNRNVVDTLVSLMVSQKLFNKLDIAVTVNYENFDYPERVGSVKRKDDIFTVRPSVEYAFKERFVLGVWYQFRDRDSNNNQFDYSNSRTGLTAKLLF